MARGGLAQGRAVRGPGGAGTRPVGAFESLGSSVFTGRKAPWPFGEPLWHCCRCRPGLRGLLLGLNCRAGGGRGGRWLHRSPELEQREDAVGQEGKLWTRSMSGAPEGRCRQRWWEASEGYAVIGITSVVRVAFKASAGAGSSLKPETLTPWGWGWGWAGALGGPSSPAGGSQAQLIRNLQKDRPWLRRLEAGVGSG